MHVPASCRCPNVSADRIITDYPDRLRRVMAERGLALPKAYRRR